MTTFHGNMIEEGEVLFLDPATDEAYHVPLHKDHARVDLSHISTYPPKQVLGDFTRAHHEVNSVYQQSEFIGGGQIRHADEATDQSRYWWGNLSTLHPYQMALPLETVSIEGDDEAIPLGDYNGSFYAAFGTALHKVSGTTKTFVATLAEVPVKTGAVAFTGTGGTTKLFIPMGAHGYQVLDGATLKALNTGVAPLQLVEWDNKLYSIDATGSLKESLDGETAWTEKLTVPRETDPRGVIEFYDKQDNPTLHIITRRAVYGCDLSLGKAYKTQLAPPPHHDAGAAAAKWRTDLYVSYGVGVHQYTGNSIISMGLDRNAGLPRDLRGAIVSMAEGYNGLYALVRGQTVLEGVDATQGFTYESGQHDIHMPPSRSKSTVQMWDSFGWSTVWESGEGDDAPTSMVISVAPGFERLWWGYGNTLLYQDIHHMYYNPEQRPDDVRYARSGMLETATMDFAMAGQKKILYAIEVMTKNLTATETIQLEYQIDDGPWIPLPVMTDQPSDKRTIFYMGHKGFFPDDVTPRYDGISFNDITIRIKMKRGDDASKTPLLESFGVVYQKVMGPLMAYSFTTPLGEEEYAECKNHTAGEVLEFLHRMVSGYELVPMLYAGKWHSVRFAGVSGQNEDGSLMTGNRTVSVLEVLD